jgi:hypothetical protein
MSDGIMTTLNRALESGARLTPAERFQRLIDIGLINEDGEVVCDINKNRRFEEQHSREEN